MGENQLLSFASKAPASRNTTGCSFAWFEWTAWGQLSCDALYSWVFNTFSLMIKRCSYKWNGKRPRISSKLLTTGSSKNTPEGLVVPYLLGALNSQWFSKVETKTEMRRCVPLPVVTRDYCFHCYLRPQMCVMQEQHRTWVLISVWPYTVEVFCRESQALSDF